MKISILTNFHELNPFYSLTSVVADQINMLLRYGHDVHLFVSEKFPPTSELPPEIHNHIRLTVHRTVLSSKLIDYQSGKDLTEEHRLFIRKYSAQLSKELADFDLVMTHDFVFTGWNLPFASTIMEVARIIPKLTWMHWIHSVPTGKKDWWNLPVAYIRGKHFLVYPNSTDANRVALQFQCSLADICVIPHIKDIRTWFDFSDDTCDFISDNPQILSSEFVQVYPVGSDRFEAKRVSILIKIFAHIKKQGHSATLIVANSHAAAAKFGRAGEVTTKDFSEYYKIARRYGLKENFILTSDFNIEKYGQGIPKKMVRELLLCSNVFVYPTREESFGLICPEASMSGAKIMILNEDLYMMNEVNANNGLFAGFGSYQRPQLGDIEKLCKETATKIIEQMETDIAVRSSTSFRRRLNYDAIYQNYYKPFFDKITGAKE